MTFEITERKKKVTWKCHLFFPPYVKKKNSYRKYTIWPKWKIIQKLLECPMGKRKHYVTYNFVFNVFLNIPYTSEAIGAWMIYWNDIKL